MCVQFGTWWAFTSARAAVGREVIHAPPLYVSIGIMYRKINHIGSKPVFNEKKSDHA